MLPMWNGDYTQKFTHSFEIQPFFSNGVGAGGRGCIFLGKTLESEFRTESAWGKLILLVAYARVSSSPRDGSWTYLPLDSNGFRWWAWCNSSQWSMRENLKEGFGEKLSFKKKKKRYIGKPISFPLWPCHAQAMISTTAAAALQPREKLTWRTRTKTAEVKETRPQIPDAFATD